MLQVSEQNAPPNEIKFIVNSNLEILCSVANFPNVGLGVVYSEVQVAPQKHCYFWVKKNRPKNKQRLFAAATS